jgi:hypothetical protein
MILYDCFDCFCILSLSSDRLLEFFDPKRPMEALLIDEETAEVLQSSILRLQQAHGQFVQQIARSKKPTTDRVDAVLRTDFFVFCIEKMVDVLTIDPADGDLAPQPTFTKPRRVMVDDQKLIESIKHALAMTLASVMPMIPNSLFSHEFQGWSPFCAAMISEVCAGSVFRRSIGRIVVRFFSLCFAAFFMLF